MKTYEIKLRKGIDDLQSEYAFVGAAQGDTSCTNEMGHHPWMVFVFKGVDQYDQDAINAEVEKRKKANLEYIKNLKESGEYGQEYIHKISFIDNPIFDTPVKSVRDTGLPMESYRMVLLDASDLNNEPNIMQIPSGSGIIAQIEAHNTKDFKILDPKSIEKALKDFRG